MKLSANLSLLYADETLETAMREAKKHGVEAVEVLFPYAVTPDALASLLAYHRLQLVLVNTPLGPNGEKGLAAIPGCEDDFLRALERALDVCRATGCRLVHVMAGQPEADQHEAALDTLLQNLAHAVPLARDAGVVLTLEALNRDDMPGYFYWQPRQVLNILQELGSPQLGLQFDFYHTQKEGLDVLAEINACADWIRHVQFAHPVGRHEPDLTDPGVRAALLRLRDIGFQGHVGAEYRPARTAAEGYGWMRQYHKLLDGPEASS